MKPLNVRLPHKTYPIYIAGDALDTLPDLLGQYHLTGDITIITDVFVGQLYSLMLEDLFEKRGIPVDILKVPAGETSKSLAVCEEIYTYLLKKGATREAVILAFGGGVIGDLAGFVAATYMRGVRFAQIPTTLLAQVDSSVGGKVGVNHALGKNLIGTFYHPEFVFIDPTVLRTLPPRELRAGLAEMIKYALIQDTRLYEIVATHLEGIIKLEDIEFLAGLIHDSCAIKARIVKQDERERGNRVILNFGHTIGHALEAATHYEYFRHGEAVTLGMAAAVYISNKAGYLPAKLADRIWQTLQCFHPPAIPESITREEVWSYLRYDKKKNASGQKWVLLRSIGSALVTNKVPEKLIEGAIDYLFTSWK